MPRKPTLSFAFIFAFCSLLIAQEWWEKIPCNDWSDEQLLIFLEFSPWVRHSSTFLIRGAMPARLDYPSGAGHPIYGGAYLPEYYVVRLLTARPLREALLEDISRGHGMVVSLNEFYKGEVELREDRLREFVAANPKSVVVRGDEQHIIISMVPVSGSLPPYMEGEHIRRVLRPKLRQNRYANQLSELTLSSLMAETSLETDTGKSIKIHDYRPPERDGLGAKFFFKRRMPEGTFFITADDKELSFKTRVDDREIKVEFDLKKMIHQGKLEY
jgi:hypothetical protein